MDAEASIRAFSYSICEICVPSSSRIVERSAARRALTDPPIGPTFPSMKSRLVAAERRKPGAAGGDVCDRLERLAHNLWWTWSAEGALLWDLLASRLAGSRRPELRRNPVALLRALPASERRRLGEMPELLSLLENIERELRSYSRPQAPPAGLSASSPVAYFSMEFGLHESLPIYAGGLGILAGDHLKSASDLGLPMVGVGLLYRQGYFRQLLDARGQQQVVYLDADFELLPMAPVLDSRGRELRIAVELPGREVALKLWRVAAGRVSLYLLDADIPENSRRDRVITRRLYIGDRETRIAQEVLAGIGGVRALRLLGIRPGVWHLNEGHVAFLTLERLRELCGSGLAPAEALEVVAADTVFTTHTPVPEGNEVFDLALADRYLRPHAEAAGIALEDYLALGRDTAPDGRSVLSMTVLALRLSRFRNGVSALHGEVSRRMWARLWPGFRPEEAPISSVTNGVHTKTWVAPQLDRLYREQLGADWAAHLGDLAFWKKARRLPEGAIWNIKLELKAELVRFVRQRVAERLRRRGWSEARCRRETDGLLNPVALTIGFARRFALYKRAALLFRDLERAAALFASPSRPLQIIFAGKPHPEDPQGKKLFEQIAAISRRPEFRGKVVLLEDYDAEMARFLVRGADLWLNNPRRPLEASGTSGQKVPINAGLNLSNLDGWWSEGYSAAAGWVFGKAREYADPALQDREDHEDLLRVLEKEVIPLYYERNGRGIPGGWLRKVKQSIELLVPRFSSHYMVEEYARRLYRPALDYGELLRDGRSALARELVRWREAVRRNWPLVHIRAACALSSRLGAELEVEAYLASLAPGDVAFCDRDGSLLQIEAVEEAGGANCYRFRLRTGPGAPGGQGRKRETRSIRLFPVHQELAHPQELGLSLEFRA
jgi:starch phosphorylase